MKAILYYFHDPMCSWCYGFNSTLENLCAHLDKQIGFKKILGGLAADTDEPMSSAMREQIKGNWQRIETTIPGVTFNYDFWQHCQPRRSTYAACRAVIAARQQGQQYDSLMTRAIQIAYYQQARNPSDDKTLIELARELDLDEQRFINDFYSKEVSELLQQEIDFSREMIVESFPSLVLVVGGDSYSINIDYNDYQVILGKIEEKMGAIN